MVDVSRLRSASDRLGQRGPLRAIQFVIKVIDMFPRVISYYNSPNNYSAYFQNRTEYGRENAIEFHEMRLERKQVYEINCYTPKLIDPLKTFNIPQSIIGPIIDWANKHLDLYINIQEIRLNKYFGNLYLNPDMVSDIKNEAYDNGSFYLTIRELDRNGFLNIEDLSKYNAEIKGIKYDCYSQTMSVYINTYEYRVNNATDNRAFKLRLQIKGNLECKFVHRGKPVLAESEPEKRALETLREMISEKDYKSYLRDGFISLKARDGKTYQVFNNRWHTKVYKDGKLIEEVCVRLSGTLPDTDNVVAFITMLKTDPDLFRKSGNVYKNLAA